MSSDIRLINPQHLLRFVPPLNDTLPAYGKENIALRTEVTHQSFSITLRRNPVFPLT